MSSFDIPLSGNERLFVFFILFFLAQAFYSIGSFFALEPIVVRGAEGQEQSLFVEIVVIFYIFSNNIRLVLLLSCGNLTAKQPERSM